MQKEESRGSLKFLLALIFVYVILFEFILPVNKFLPKPSLLFESIIHIWKDYGLVYGFSITISMVFVSLILSYVSAYMNSPQLFKFSEKNLESIGKLKIFGLVPIIFIIAAFGFWFSEYFFAEFLFVLLTSALLSYSSVLRNSKFVKQEFLDVAKNLGLTPIDIYERVYWKAVQPALAKNYQEIHLKMWGIVLAFEFIINAHGLGHDLRMIIEYKDFTALINVAWMTAVLVWLGDLLIRFLRNKFISWNV